MNNFNVEIVVQCQVRGNRLKMNCVRTEVDVTEINVYSGHSEGLHQPLDGYLGLLV